MRTYKDLLTKAYYKDLNVKPFLHVLSIIIAHVYAYVL